MSESGAGGDGRSGAGTGAGGLCARLDVLAAALDEVIPPSDDGRLPGAGQLGIAPDVAAQITRNPFLEPVLSRSLSRLEELAREHGAHGFADLPPERRGPLFQTIVAAEPDFVPALLFPTYVAYYQHPRVLVALGRAPEPPFPKGYTLKPFDETLLDPVRRRGPVVRRA